ncbi:MAG: hypothetical protein U0797_25825 [Gemmataceae bacterium]
MTRATVWRTSSHFWGAAVFSSSCSMLPDVSTRNTTRSPVSSMPAKRDSAAVIRTCFSFSARASFRSAAASAACRSLTTFDIAASLSRAASSSLLQRRCRGLRPLLGGGEVGLQGLQRRLALAQVGAGRP